MTDVTERLIDMMHADPDSLSGAPSDAQIIAKYRFDPDTELSKPVRQGFLEMWLPGKVIDEISGLTDDELIGVVAAYEDEAEELAKLEAGARDMRFLATQARNTLAIRNTIKQSIQEQGGK